MSGTALQSSKNQMKWYNLSWIGSETLRSLFSHTLLILTKSSKLKNDVDINYPEDDLAFQVMTGEIEKIWEMWCIFQGVLSS